MDCLVTKLKEGVTGSDYEYFVPDIVYKGSFNDHWNTLQEGITLVKGYYRLTLKTSTTGRQQVDYLRIYRGSGTSDVIKNMELPTTEYQVSNIIEITEDIPDCRLVAYINTYGIEYTASLEYFKEFPEIDWEFNGIPRWHSELPVDDDAQMLILEPGKTYRLEADCDNNQREIQDYISIRDSADTILLNIEFPANSTHVQYDLTVQSIVPDAWVRAYVNAQDQVYHFKFYEVKNN